VKYLPIIALTIAVSACATQPTDHFASIGNSAKAPKDVAVCIASSWATKTQQPIVSQTTIANDMGVDVLVPGQPPGGSAAIVRPAMQGNGTWVGFRSADGAVPGPDVTSDISACL
jgi:hypothetical protein